jgi:hypothetical protein
MKRNRTQKVRGPWTEQEDFKILKAVQEMSTSWSKIQAANILSGRTVQAMTNHFHTELKFQNVDLDVVPMVSNSSAFESLQVWHNSPIAFDCDRDANVLATSEVIFFTLCA